MIGFFKKRAERLKQARKLYDAAVVQARDTGFYKSMGVPDTFDGRFEMISIHCFFIINRLKEQGDKALSQKTFDVFFKDMDVSLRELGVGDVGIPKHMKRMMRGFNGRATNYAGGLASNDKGILVDALTRNVYGTVEPSQENLDAMIAYMNWVTEFLKDQDLITNSPDFPTVTAKRGRKSA